MNRPRLAAVDALRGLLWPGVVLVHAGVASGAWAGLAVELFFLLSGALVMWLAIREHDETGRVDRLAFASRRIRRIWLPTAGTALAACVLGAMPWRDLPVVASMAVGVVMGDGARAPAALGATWSLTTEEVGYAMLALAAPLVAASRRSRAWLASCLALVAGIFAWRWSAHVAADGIVPFVERLYYHPSRVTGVLLGAVLGWIAARRTRWASAAAWCALPALLALVQWSGSWPTWQHAHGHVVWPLVVDVLAAPLVLAALTGGAEWLAAPWLVALGRRSLWGYLLHGPAMVLAARLPVVVQIAIVALVTEAAYRLVDGGGWRRLRLPARETAAINPAARWA